MWRFWLIECFNFCPHDDFIQFFNNLVPTFFTDSGILQKSSTKRWILGQILLFFISTLKSDFMFLICLCSSVYAFQICRIGSVSELLNKEELCGGATDDYYYTHQGINLTYTVHVWWLINDIIIYNSMMDIKDEVLPKWLAMTSDRAGPGSKRSSHRLPAAPRRDREGKEENCFFFSQIGIFQERNSKTDAFKPWTMEVCLEMWQ